MNVSLNPAERAFLVCLGLAVLVLGALHALLGLWPFVLVTITLSAGGVLAHWRWRWLSSFVLAGLTVIAANGLLRYSMPPFGLLIAVAAALAAWDLDEFSLQLKRYEDDVRVAGLWREHIRRLLVVLGSALAMGLFDLTVRLSLGFGLTVLLGVLVFLGVAQAARLLRRQ